MRPRGVHTALVTPFSGPSPDLDALDALCARQLDAGIHGLVACGTTGEAPTLGAGEWERVVARVVARSGGRVPVTAGCGTNCTSTTVERVRRARGIGADAALVVLPYYNKPNPAGHLAHARAVASVGLPIVLYHVPGRTGQRLPVEQLAALAATPGVVAVKEASGDVAYGSELIERSQVAVLSGDDFTWFPLACAGAAGVISVLSNVDPWRCVELMAAIDRGDLVRARELHHAMMPLVRFLFSSTNPVPCKAALAALGLCQNRLRLPLAAGPPPDPALLEGVRR